MKYAKFSDTFLSDFRLDDNGETLVLTDKRGCTRAVKLLPYKERPKGEWVKTHNMSKRSYRRMCTNCYNISFFCGDGDYPNCPYCLADMRKGGVK